MTSRSNLDAADKGKANRRAELVLDEIEANVAVLDNEGYIVATNKGWRDFAQDNPLPGATPPKNVAVGSNYLEICQNASGKCSEGATVAYDGIRSVLEGRKRCFIHEYPCHSPDKQRWFLMKVKPLRGTHPKEVAVIHVDVTDRLSAEADLRAKKVELHAVLDQMQDMAARMKLALPDTPHDSSSVATVLAPFALPHALQSDQDRLKLLSQRELQVLAGIVSGERNAMMASRLNLSKKSISTYRYRILVKLQVTNDAQLIAMAGRMGLL